MAEIVQITYSSSLPGSSCLLTANQLKSYGIGGESEMIKLSAGFLNVYLHKVILKDNDMHSNTICFSKDVWSYIHIPEGTVLQIRKTGAGQLDLGPLIGIFVNRYNLVDLLHGKTATAYLQYDDACKSLYGLCCFFSIGDIDRDNRIIKGVIRKNRKWVKCILPLPKVIYDRNVEGNCRVESTQLRKMLGGECHILNPMPKLTKWKTIVVLRRNPALSDIIPLTVPFRSASDIENMLEKSSYIYLKPDSLSKGKGIFRVSRTSDGQYQVEYRTKEENHKRNLSVLDDIETLLIEYEEKGGGYLVQEEIKKASYLGNPFDFRLLYQKDWQGIWQPSGIAGRISAPESIITSPRSGGKVEELPTILKEVFNEDISTEGGLYENVMNLGREIALTIERKFGDCVELGLDMTIDVNRKIWVIEVNGKPLKVSLKRLNNPAMVSRCNKRPIEYAVLSAGFRSADTESGGLADTCRSIQGI